MSAGEGSAAGGLQVLPAWRGRTALVTGASRGIGAAVAVSLAAAGAHVVLLGRDTDALTAVAAACRDATSAGTPSPLPLVVDLTDAPALDRAVGDALAVLGDRLDLLANVAGASLRHARVEEMTDADWQASLDLNLMARCGCSARASPRSPRLRGPSST